MLMVFVVITVLLYCSSATIQYLQVTNKASTSFNEHKSISKILAIIAIIMHTFILQASLHLEQGLNLSIFTSGSLVSWLVALVLLISSFRQKVDNLFIAVFPMAALLILLDVFFAHPEPKPYTTGVISHILLSILSYSVFTLAAFQAVLLHKQNHALKHNISGKLLNSLPPLQTMERLLFEMLWTGFILLSAALVTGFIFVDSIVAQHLVHKSLFSLVSWSIFATLLFGRNFWGWRGARAIRWTIGGFVSLMLGFFGSKLVLEIFISTS
ncbi:MAG: ABC-type uncharacterized transport system permease subunit [Oceanospirillaceae bacterium]|jgi:ABC-type uncharacterized transport system permease subunit